MRVRVLLLIAVFGLCAALSPAADTDLVSRLLAAKTAEERGQLLHGQARTDLGAALGQIETVAATGFDAKDYAAALNAYETASVLAREIGNDAPMPMYFRRIGLCHSYLGQSDAALSSYREGVVAAEKTGDAEFLVENLHGVANSLQRIGRFQEALPISARELDLAEKSGKPLPVLHALTTQAQILGELGRLREELPLNERAYEISRVSGVGDDYTRALGNLAAVYGELGDYETALRMLRTLKSPTAYEMNSIGICEERLRHYADAETAYLAGIAASTAPNLWRIRAGIFVNLAVLQHRMGKLPEARTSAEQALSVSLTQHDLGEASSALAQISEIAADEGDSAEAMKEGAESLRMARESESPDLIVNGLTAEARAFEAAGRDGDAERTYGEALSIIENRREDAPASAAGLQGELDEWMPAYQYAVSHAIHAGKAMAALQLADRAKGRVLLDMLDGGQPGLDTLADPGERAEEQQVREGVARARLAAITKPSAGTKAALENALRTEEDVHVRLFSRHPELVLQRASPREIRAEDLTALAPGDQTALLSYFVLPDSVELFVVRRGGNDRTGTPEVRMFRMAEIGKLDALIRSFRAQIGARDLDYRVSARALYDALIAPASVALRGTTRWVISPDGALWDVPFQALMDPQGKHVLETRSLSYAPSFSVLRQLQERPAVKEPPRTKLLAVANPVVEGMAPIPDADREAKALATLYGSTASMLLTGDQANVGLFRENAAGADVIHITSHAETETNHPLESFLVFSQNKPKASGKSVASDGALTARDLLGMRLRANLVVLSACETARGKIGQGDGVMGLGWAVLAAGARVSVMSQWKVDSAATGDLMIDFHRRLTGASAAARKTSGNVDEALRQASLDIMRTPGRLHPFYWAGFIAIGDAASLK